MRVPNTTLSGVSRVAEAIQQDSRLADQGLLLLGNLCLEAATARQIADLNLLDAIQGNRFDSVPQLHKVRLCPPGPDARVKGRV